MPRCIIAWDSEDGVVMGGGVSEVQPGLDGDFCLAVWIDGGARWTDTTLCEVEWSGWDTTSVSGGAPPPNVFTVGPSG